MNKLILTAALAGIAMILGVGLLLSGSTPEPTAGTMPTDKIEVTNLTTTELMHDEPTPPQLSNLAETPETKMTHLSTALRAEFGSSISNVKIQIRVLEKMIEALKKLYGEHWQDHMEEMIRLTFPDLVELLLPRFQNLLSYNEWALAQRDQVANMSELERRQFTWAKRTELFGDDAEMIWQGNLRSERVQDVLADLKDNPELPLEQKIDYYLEQFNEIYQSDAAQALGNHRQEVMDQFLTVDTVQNDLHKMPEPERRQHLRQLRKAVGLDEDALTRWDELDTVRAQRWHEGKNYLEQRAQVTATVQGDELETKIQELQQRIFGEGAAIIRNEEATGYFRYEGEQQLGLN